MIVVPTKAEFQMAVAMAFPEMVLASGEEKQGGFFTSIWMKIKETWDIMLQYKRDNLFFFVACTAGYLFF